MVYVGSSWVELDRWSDATGYGNNAEWRVLAYSTQDIAANTSRVYFKLQKSVSANTAWSYDNKSFRISGSGAAGDGHSATQTWNYGTVSDTSWNDVGGDTSDMYWSGVKHNDNGSLTVSATASGDRVMGGTFSTGISIQLPTIARASVPTASPNPITIDDLGNTLTVYTNRKSSTFTHTIKVQCGSWSWTSSARSVGTSVNVTIPYSVIAQFSATSTTASATVTCTTFNGTTQIGSAQTCSVKFQINPNRDHANVGTITVEDTNSRTSAVTQDDSIYIANISTLQATIPLTVSGSYTELAQAVVTCGNKSQSYTLSGTSASLTFIFDKVNASSLSVKVTDKRGNSVTGSKSWTLIQYQPITLTATVGRPSATGSAGVGQITGMAYGGNFGATQNSLNISIDFKKHDDPDYDPQGTETATLALGQSGYNSYTDAFTFNYTLDYQYQYDVKFTVSDLFSTATYVAQLMQGLPIISWDENEVDVFGNLHIHDRDNPTVWQDVFYGFDGLAMGDGVKNVLMNLTPTETKSGITYTKNGDGSVSCSGTYTANSWHYIGEITLEAGTYILSGCPYGGGTSTYTLRASNTNDSGLGTDSGNGVTITLTQVTTVVVRIYAYSNDISGKTFFPMLRDARIASSVYHRGAPSNYALMPSWNYKSFSNTGNGITSGAVRWITFGRICYAVFYDVQMTAVSHSHNSLILSGMPKAENAILFLLSNFGTGSYSAMRVKIDTDGCVYFHYAGSSLATQYYGQVIYLIKT